MSRSPISAGADRLTIALCPAQLGVVRQRGGRLGFLGRTPPERGVIDLPNPAEPPELPSLPTWQPAVDTLAQWLDEAHIQKARVKLVLSNRFVRFALIPWSVKVATDDEEAALMRGHFDHLYGDMRGWTPQLDTGRYGEPRIACAVEDALLAALTRVFAAHKITRYSIVPYFVAAWNQQKKQVGTSDALFVTAESGCIALVSFKSGAVRSVRNLQSAMDAQTVCTVLQREALLQGFNELPRSLVLAPSLSQDAVAAWPAAIQWVATGVEAAHAALGVSLSGVDR